METANGNREWKPRVGSESGDDGALTATELGGASERSCALVPRAGAFANALAVMVSGGGIAQGLNHPSQTNHGVTPDGRLLHRRDAGSGYGALRARFTGGDVENVLGLEGPAAVRNAVADGSDDRIIRSRRSA